MSERMKFLRDVVARHKQNPELACIEWPYPRDRSGYGWFTALGEKRAHRVCFILNGGLCAGLSVMHSCDNPACVNPAHLSAGTHAENMAQMAERGRYVLPANSGSAHGKSKLTESSVAEMRRLAGEGVPLRRLARDYGVARRTAENAILGVTWRHVQP